MSEPERPDEAPDFGPSGYLPDRAARRARKIVLRAPLGIQWVVGSLVVGLVVVVAGYLALRPTTPGPPFVELPPSALPEATGGEPTTVEVAGGDVVVIGVLGRARAFDWSEPTTLPPRYCPASGLLESDDGGVWRATGRGVGGTASLTELPSVTVDGRVFVDPTDPLPVLDPDPDAAPEVACGAAA